MERGSTARETGLGVDQIVGEFWGGKSWEESVRHHNADLETLDGNGKVIGHSSGWVSGDVPARGRAYFLVPIALPGAGYRVSVESYDPISVDAEAGGERPSGVPSASPSVLPR